MDPVPVLSGVPQRIARRLGGRRGATGQSYRRYGDESTFDLVVLCDRCHELFHGLVEDASKRASGLVPKGVWVEGHHVHGAKRAACGGNTKRGRKTLITSVRAGRAQDSYKVS